MDKHPNKCPECGSEAVLYERFVGEHGSYCCDDCEWEEGSGAVNFIDENIEKSERGESEPVLAPEHQMIYLLGEFDRIWDEHFYEFAGKKIKAFDRAK
jgi:hypothetical protein